MTRRLCIVSPHLTGGGAEYQIECLSGVLARHGGFEIYFIVHFAGTGADMGTVARSYQVVPVSRSPRVSRLGYLADAWPLYRALRAIRPDVIYQRVSGGFTGICAHYARMNAIRMVWHVSSDADVSTTSDFYARNPVTRRLEQLARDYGARHASHIVTQTAEQARLLLANHGRRAAAIVPNFHPPPGEPLDKSGPLTVLWIANFKSLKRPEVFVRLAAALTDCSNTRFVMIGATNFGGSERAAGERLSASMARITNLSHLGQLPQAEVNQWLAASHLLVSTSRREGFPNTFIQAWLRAVPVVSLDINPDGVLDAASTGVCVTTEEQLCQTVRAMLSDRSRLSAMGARALEYAEQHHSMRNAQRVVALLQQPHTPE